MTPAELRQAVQERFGDQVYVTERPGLGKTVVEAGMVVRGTQRTKEYRKAITFNAASIPADALNKIERAIA